MERFLYSISSVFEKLHDYCQRYLRGKKFYCYCCILVTLKSVEGVGQIFSTIDVLHLSFHKINTHGLRVRHNLNLVRGKARFHRPYGFLLICKSSCDHN